MSALSHLTRPSPSRPSRLPWRHPRVVFPSSLATLALASVPACSEPNRADRRLADTSRAAMDSGAATATGTAPESASATVGGDGSPIRLTALTAAEIQDARLSGELTCSFAKPDAPPLLVARGNVASTQRAQGIVKVLDSIERVSAPGGFDGIVGGGTFVGRGTTIRIAPTGAAIGGGESPPRPGTLTYDRADGARRTVRGLWTCGP